MNRNNWTGHEDREFMVNFYNSLPERIEDLAGEELVKNIKLPIYTK